jgi:hypothetical protein
VKVFGIFNLFHFVVTAVSFVSILSMVSGPRSVAGGMFHSSWMQFFWIAFYLIISLVVLFLLIFKTDRLADWLHLPDNDILVSLDSDGLMRVGILLLGIYFFLSGVTRLSGNMISMGAAIAMGMQSYRFSQVISPLIMVFSGALLVFWADRVRELIMRWSQAGAKSIIGWVLLFIVGIALVSFTVGRIKLKRTHGVSYSVCQDFGPVSVSSTPVPAPRKLYLESATNGPVLAGEGGAASAVSVTVALPTNTTASSNGVYVPQPALYQ